MSQLYNPFTPSEIAGNPDDFFGRSDELNQFGQYLPQGCVAIQGAVGIGKSSLLSRGLIHMEGFGADHSAQSVIAVGDKDVKTVDEAARLILESPVNLSPVDDSRYALVDEFLRIRHILSEIESPRQQRDAERSLIKFLSSRAARLPTDEL